MTYKQGLWDKLFLVLLSSYIIIIHDKSRGLQDTAYLPGRGGIQWDFLHLFLNRHLPYLMNSKHISLPVASNGMGIPDLVRFTLENWKVMKRSNKIKKGFGVSLQQYPLVGVIRRIFDKSSCDISFQDGRYIITFQRNLLPPWYVVNADFTGWSVALEKEHCMGVAGLRGAVYYACSVQVFQNVWQRPKTAVWQHDLRGR